MYDKGKLVDSREDLTMEIEEKNSSEKNVKNTKIQAEKKRDVIDLT